LVEYLGKRNKLAHLLVPSQRNYSALLKNATVEISFVSDLRRQIEYKPYNRRSDSRPQASRATRSSDNNRTQSKKTANKPDGWTPIANQPAQTVANPDNQSTRPKQQSKSNQSSRSQSSSSDKPAGIKTSPKPVIKSRSQNRQKPAGYRKSVA